MNETTKQIQLVDDIPILYSLFVGSNPHFSGVDPAAMTSRRQVAQTLCTSPGLQLTHVSGLIGDKNHGDFIRIQWIQWGYRQKSAVALSKKFHTTFYGNFKWENGISNCWMEWGMSLTHSNPRNDCSFGFKLPCSTVDYLGHISRLSLSRLAQPNFKISSVSR